MLQLFELVIVAFLAVIAIELLLIHRDLASRPKGVASYNDEAPGQTINVNVGAPAGTASPVISVSKELDARKDGASDASAGILAETAATVVEEATTEEAPLARPAANQSVRSTSSGLIAKKCPTCGNENSSYRSECFNCGAVL